MEFKTGDRVTCKIEGEEINDAKIYKDLDYCYICQNIKHGVDAPDKLGYKSSWAFYPSNPKRDGITNLTKVSKSDLSFVCKEDSILEIDPDRYDSDNPYGRDVIVLAKCGDLVAISIHTNIPKKVIEPVSIKWYTTERLEYLGYKLKEEEKITIDGTSYKKSFVKKALKKFYN